eukprot:TRINITY_DN2526_c0_g1_i1.p1 TRINITY_DN2526_c0_g1~~TRINITY_DN2526_c0_g1_i1.p1  ORF type:complete len:341 (-),score=101.20 TRINITY_DN2526_c0_g1_i1:189-1211(-)
MSGQAPTNSSNNGNEPTPPNSHHMARPSMGQLDSLSSGPNGIKTDDSHLSQYPGQTQYASQPNHLMMAAMGGTPGISEDDSEPPTQEKATERKPGRRKINIEFIDDKSRRHITFSKRKAGIMKKAYELSALTGTQVLLLVASETGHVYTFATPKLQPLITKPEGKNLIQTCLNAPDIPQIPSQNHQPPANTPRRAQQTFAESPYPEQEISSNMGSYGSASGAVGYMPHQSPQIRYQAPNSAASTPMNRYASQPESSQGMPPQPQHMYGYSHPGGSSYASQGLEPEYNMMGTQYGPSTGWNSNSGSNQHMAHMHPQHQQGQMGKMTTESQLQQLGNTSLPS